MDDKEIIDAAQRYRNFLAKNPSYKAILHPNGAHCSDPVNIGCSGIGLYFRMEHSVLSIFFNQLQSSFGRQKRILHLIYTVALMLSITVLLDVMWFQNLRSECERVRFCSDSCRSNAGFGQDCPRLPEVTGDADLELVDGYELWFTYTFASELSLDFDKCGPFPEQPKVCRPCEQFPFASDEERDRVCGNGGVGSNNNNGGVVISVCPVPTGICSSAFLTNVLRGLVVWVITTPVSLVIRGCLRCYGRGCLGSSVSFLFLLAAFAAIVVALFVIASVVSQFTAIARLFATSWMLSLLLEFPLLSLLFACCGGRSRLEEKLAQLREKAGMSAPMMRVPVVPRLIPVRHAFQ